jgi:glycosyltransferase involved in cell wall biosynthesis
MRKRAVYILNHYSATDSSHFWHVLNLLEALAGRGVELLVIVEKSEGLPQFRAPGITVRGLASRRPFLRHLELIWRIRNAIRQGYSSVFVRIALPATLCALLACMGTRTRVMYWQSGTVHDFDRDQPLSLNKLRWWLSTALPFAIVKRAVHRFVTGPETMIEYYRDRVGISPCRLTLLYNDIDLGRFVCADPQELKLATRARLGIAPDAFVLLFVHRFSPVRRTLFYMPYVIDKALTERRGQEVVCVVAGGGAELGAFKRAISSSLQSVRYVLLGDVPNKDIQNLYHAADVFLHPTYNEGFPRVVLEAMAAGLPIVTTDAGGTADLLGKAQQRFVVARDDRDTLADRLGEILANARLRKELADENLATVERFSTPRVSAMYEQVLFS